MEPAVRARILTGQAPEYDILIQDHFPNCILSINSIRFLCKLVVRADCCHDSFFFYFHFFFPFHCGHVSCPSCNITFREIGTVTTLFRTLRFRIARNFAPKMADISLSGDASFDWFFSSYEPRDKSVAKAFQTGRLVPRADARVILLSLKLSAHQIP